MPRKRKVSDSSIGVGLMFAGYFYPDDSAGITKAVEDFEKE